MSKIDEAKELLIALGVPTQQQTMVCCYSLLALAQLSENTLWGSATNSWMRIHDIIQFIDNQYKIKYAENTRETFRKQAMHHFRIAAFIEDNGTATNSPKYRYRLTKEMLTLIKTYKSSAWDAALELFLKQHPTLSEIYASKRSFNKIPVNINGKELTLSPGKHNRLQVAIINEFAPRFAPNSECVYFGDTTKRDLEKNEELLKKLGFKITKHDKMPDIVLYSKEKNWLFFIEAVTSCGAMEPKRIHEIQEMTANVAADNIYVTAFLDRATCKKHFAELAWETEIWIAEEPDHMVHLNGDKFLGPRKHKTP